MTERELKKNLSGLVAAYFPLLHEMGNIVWGKTKPVKPANPHVSVNLSGIKRPIRPMRIYVDGIVHDSYPSETILTINLITKGAPTSNEPNIISSNENTAVNDLTGFANFINSPYVDIWCARTGITLKANAVRDLTALTHGSSWEYRAFLEVNVGFVQYAAGHTGLNYENGVPLHPNGRPMFDGETGMPLYDNGQQMYDNEGNPLDSDGNKLPEGEPLPPLPPPSVNDNGIPLIPPLTPDSSGGGSQELADKATGYFTEVEINKK